MLRLNENDNIQIFGVFDGHGDEGHRVSQFLKKTLPKCLNKALNQNKDYQGNYQLKNVIKQGFSLTNQELSLKQTIETDYSGSTCIIALIYGEQLYVANVGDSRAILGKKIRTIKQKKYLNSNQVEEICYSQQSIQSQNCYLGEEFNMEEEEEEVEWKIKCLSTDHKPDCQRERDRIINFGGIIKKTSKKGYRSGPERVWVKDQDYPGLAMTRSFGDYNGVEAGIVYEPEIFQYQLQSFDKIIVLATDGVWDMIDSKQVIQMLIPYYENNDAKGGVNHITKTAQNLWIRSDNNHIDDITCVVIFLDSKNPMKIDKISKQSI